MSSLIRVTACTAVAVVAACGGGGSPTATPAPTPVPAPIVIAEGSWDLGAGFLATREFEIPSTGTIDLTVTCTFPDTWLQLWLERGDCEFYQFQNNQCDLVVSTYEQGTSRTVSETNQPAGSYKVYIRNSGEHYEQGGYQVVFTAQAG